MDYPKCPVGEKGMYFHHKYKYHFIFKCSLFKNKPEKFQ